MPVVTSSSPSGFSVVIDPDDSPLNIADGSSYRPITQIGLPDWPLKSVYAGSFDTWGSLPAAPHMYDNDTLAIPLRIYGTSAANLLTQIGLVRKKVAKLNRAEQHGIGGEVEITFPSGNSYRFQVVEARAVHNLTQGFITRFRVDDELRLTVLPGARGEEVQLATSSGNGQMVMVADALKGELPGLGRLVVGATSQDQAAVHVGVQSQHYDAASTAALSFNGTDLTPLGTSTDTGSAIRNTDLIPAWQAIGSTQLAGVGHMTHVGDFQVWVRTRRPTGNTGAVSLRFAYAQGTTFRNPTTLDTDRVDFGVDEREGVDCWVSLGQIHLPEPVQGSTKWQGRFEALSSVAGDEIDIKAVRLWSVSEGYIELSDPVVFETLLSPSARDEFDQTSGALAGKTAPVGGNWAGAGDADDFQVSGSGTLTRTAVSDAGGVGRYAVSGVAGFAAQAVQVDFTALSTLSLQRGVILRYVDANNFAFAWVFQNTVLEMLMMIGGSVQVLKAGFAIPSPVGAGSTATLRAQIDAAGRWYVWYGPQGGTFTEPLIQGQSATLATGGTLASGKPGIIDLYSAAAAQTRTYDNFLAFVPTQPAAVYSGKRLEVRHDTAVREETTTDEWSVVPVRDGNYLRLAPAGMEGRVNRVAVAAYRNDPDTMGNDNDDALTATLYGTPVYLSVPEP